MTTRPAPDAPRAVVMRRADPLSNADDHMGGQLSGPYAFADCIFYVATAVTARGR